MTRCLTMIACMVAMVSLHGMTGCQQGSKSTTGHTVSALEGEWTLQSIDGDDVAKPLPERSRRPNLTITGDGKVGGFGGVNRLGSALDVAAIPAGEFKLSPIISTKMAGPPASMDLENRFTRLLGEAATFELQGDSLVVRNAQKSSAMTFSRAK